MVVIGKHGRPAAGHLDLELLIASFEAGQFRLDNLLSIMSSNKFCSQFALCLCSYIKQCGVLSVSSGSLSLNVATSADSVRDFVQEVALAT